MPDAATPTRCGVVALVGAPNAGKSTLVNRLVGSKIAAVTHKAQTTRAPLRGVAVRGPAQVILVDTPGVFSPRRRLDRAMVGAAMGAISDADVNVHVVDAPAAGRLLAGGGKGADAHGAEDARTVRDAIAAAGGGAFLALNKVDAMARPALLAVTQALFDPDAYAQVFMISAATGDGVDDLMDALCARMPEGPWLFPEDQAADAPLRVLAAEITREKLMLRLHDELPYEATVETESWEERRDGSVRIEQIIYVARDSHRKIAIGEGGAVVKTIGEAARKEMEAAFERRVHLFLTVKTREGWADERARYRAMGLDFGD